MLEDELRETFAAKAGSLPPGPLASLNGVADAALLGAARIRRRRRQAVTGLSGLVAIAAASVVVLQTFTGGGAPGGPVAESSQQPTIEQRPSPGPASLPPGPTGMREVDAIGPSAQAATKVRFQLPAASTVTAAYQAKDGYLVVNTQPDGDKQLVLQDDSQKPPQVLVDDASNIAVARDGKTVAWAAQGQMNVGSRANGDGGGNKKDDSNKITKTVSTDVPRDTQPVTFVGNKLVLSSESQGFDVWRTDRVYNPSWDKTVVRVFGGTTDSGGVYAEVAAAGTDTAMCLAQLLFDQPFTVKNKICGLPMAAKLGGRISPDGRWLAYPVEGLKQVAIVDLTTVFTGAKPKLWPLTVTAKTVWLNSTTFVVDTGRKFLKLNPTGKTGDYQPLDQDEPDDQETTDQVVLIEPLEAQ
ncbi:hypothetical protein [Dactylosporangium sp. CA-139066]|uniref:hypothetical protein n=1 Tax=Dactylosporangium sp. CA-139066 TaxID=3239930 RepID=UPI003D8A5881